MLNSLVEMSESDFKKIMDINLYGVYLMNKTFLPLLNKGSRIIITTSELAIVDPLPFTGIYAISKTALDRYAYSLRMELQLLGIHVSVIRAGAIQTGMLGVSTQALDRFTEETQLYSCNAKRFHQIVDKVEAKCVSPTKIAELVNKILKKKKPKFAYQINRNFLLKLFNILPTRMQFWAIRKVLKKQGKCYFMKKIILYIHGKGGSSKEATFYQSFLKEEVVGVDYDATYPWLAKKDILNVYKKYEKENEVIIIANSIGAYFTMLALNEMKVSQVFFISPMITLEKMILKMMKDAQVSEEELKEK